MANEWYRKNTWSLDDEQDFFEHLKKSKSSFHKVQYLRIQAVHLYETKNPKFFDGAIKLLYLCLEYKEKSQHGAALHLLGRIYWEKNKIDEAFEFLKKAAEFEIEYPNVISGAFLDYPRFIVTENRKHLYDEAKKYIEDNYERGLVFPMQIYVGNAILAIIYNEKGEVEKARQFKQIANNAAELKESGFRYHKNIGLVKTDKIFENLMKKIR